MATTLDSAWGLWHVSRVRTLRNHRLVITGASSGLGKAAAIELASSGAEVTGVARRIDAIPDNSGIHPLGLDLTSADAAEIIASLAIDGLILNAGATYMKPFTQADDGDDARLVDINISANLRIVRAVVDRWRSEGRAGRILVVASLGGLVPLPRQATYCGTKAFLVQWGLALREELKGDGISIGVFAPGGIQTPMTDTPELSHLASHLAPVEDVAGQLVRAYRGDAGLVVPGAGNKASALAARLLPRSWVTSVVSKIYEPPQG